VVIRKTDYQTRNRQQVNKPAVIYTCIIGKRQRLQKRNGNASTYQANKAA